MEFIQKTLSCTNCFKTLQSPVTLLCGVTICKHHINEQEKEFYCVKCNKNHSIPKDGFQINEILDTMLKSKLNNLHFGEEYQQVVDAVQDLEKLIKCSRLLLQDPNFEIDKVICDLKGDIDLKREQLKLEIDTEADKLIQQVMNYQNECKKKAKEFDFKQLDEKVKALEDEVEKSKDELNVILIDKPKWKAIKKSLQVTQAHSKVLNDDFSNIRTELFLNKLDIYKREKQLDLFVGNSYLR